MARGPLAQLAGSSCSCSSSSFHSAKAASSATARTHVVSALMGATSSCSSTSTSSMLYFQHFYTTRPAAGAAVAPRGLGKIVVQHDTTTIAFRSQNHSKFFLSSGVLGSSRMVCTRTNGGSSCSSSRPRNYMETMRGTSRTRGGAATATTIARGGQHPSTTTTMETMHQGRHQDRELWSRTRSASCLMQIAGRSQAAWAAASSAAGGRASGDHRYFCGAGGGGTGTRPSFSNSIHGLLGRGGKQIQNQKHFFSTTAIQPSPTAEAAALHEPLSSGTSAATKIMTEDLKQFYHFHVDQYQEQMRQDFLKKQKENNASYEITEDNLTGEKDLLADPSSYESAIDRLSKINDPEFFKASPKTRTLPTDGRHLASYPGTSDVLRNIALGAVPKYCHQWLPRKDATFQVSTDYYSEKERVEFVDETRNQLVELNQLELYNRGGNVHPGGCLLQVTQDGAVVERDAEKDRELIPRSVRMALAKKPINPVHERLSLDEGSFGICPKTGRKSRAMKAHDHMVKGQWGGLYGFSFLFSLTWIMKYSLASQTDVTVVTDPKRRISGFYSVSNIKVLVVLLLLHACCAIKILVAGALLQLALPKSKNTIREDKFRFNANTFWHDTPRTRKSWIGCKG
ncbi:unnamed protein product [Amoebophrya sp. A120]|nr:unnamed protein product [Amoebophrya sp. A120]|eukprot:GSA120T00025569001.1